MKALRLCFGRTKITLTLSTIIKEKQDAVTYTLQSYTRNCQPPETPTMRFRRLAENFSRVGSLYLPIRRLGTVRFNVLNIRYRVAVQIKRCQLPAPNYRATRRGTCRFARSRESSLNVFPITIVSSFLVNRTNKNTRRNRNIFLQSLICN